MTYGTYGQQKVRQIRRFIDRREREWEQHYQNLLAFNGDKAESEG